MDMPKFVRKNIKRFSGESITFIVRQAVVSNLNEVIPLIIYSIYSLYYIYFSQHKCIINA